MEQVAKMQKIKQKPVKEHTKVENPADIFSVRKR